MIILTKQSEIRLRTDGMMNEMCYTGFSINERGLLIMKTTFYKLRRNRAVSGVLAGLSDKFGLDVGLVRFLFVLFTVFNFGLGIIVYIILAAVIPYKEDVEEEMYGTGPRKRKEAEAIKEDDGWFW
ncbi:PspC domain-containing protein [Streptococcus anginosus]|nr:PspC domain-containing protein [Streptococcus anginosus]